MTSMWFFSSLALLAFASPTPGDKCVCLPDQGCWPSICEWDTLNTTVGGKLSAIYPLGKPCHDPTFDNATCQTIAKLYSNSSWKADQIGGLQQVNWEVNPALNETCYIDSSRSIPCSQGNIPVYGVAAESPDDISSVILFAIHHNLRLVIKNTGHDYLGRSTAAGALSIWTHNLQNITFSDNFIPKGGKDGVGTTVTIAAGVQLANLYYAVGKMNQSVVAGMAHTVGAAGGYIQGGGHSPMANWKGQSTDNAIEFQVVTASGEFVTANDFMNQDLFWALRGGGGGTFGVVVSVTLKTFPEPPVIIQNLNITFPDIPSLWSFSEIYLRALPAIDDAGGSGYWFIDPTGYILNNSKPTFVTIHYFFDKRNLAVIDKLIDPLYTVAKSMNGTNVVNITIPVPQARYVFPHPGGSDSTGKNTVLGTRLYSRRNLESPNGAGNLIKALYNITTHYPTIIEGHLTAGGQVARNAHLDTALNPSWRVALGEVIIPIGWDDSTPYEVQQEMIKALTEIEMPRLIAVDPEMGTYTNEANAYESKGILF